MTDDDRLLAAELSIGLLTGDEHARASARAAHEVAFAREVEWWHQQMAPLLDAADEVEPPAALRDRIEQRLTIPLPAEARGRSRWRWIGIGGALGALAASIIAWTHPVTRTVQVPAPLTVATSPDLLVASLLPTDKAATQPIVAVFDRDTATLRLSTSVAVPGGRAGELWRIPAGGKPISLGVLADVGDHRLAVSRSQRLAAGDQLAVSVEPAGGSPTGQPTGPVILAGALSHV